MFRIRQVTTNIAAMHVGVGAGRERTDLLVAAIRNSILRLLGVASRLPQIGVLKG